MCVRGRETVTGSMHVCQGEGEGEGEYACVSGGGRLEDDVCQGEGEGEGEYACVRERERVRSMHM